MLIAGDNNFYNENATQKTVENLKSPAKNAKNAKFYNKNVTLINNVKNIKDYTIETTTKISSGTGLESEKDLMQDKLNAAVVMLESMAEQQNNLLNLLATTTEATSNNNYDNKLENCDKIATDADANAASTPSLKQEMNLARRACWSSKADAAEKESEETMNADGAVNSENLTKLNLNAKETKQTESTLTRRKGKAKQVDESTVTNVNTQKNTKTTAAELEATAKAEAEKAAAQQKLRNELAASSKFWQFWFAFLAFCDSITIKPDDPRFAEARRLDEQQRKANAEAAKAQPKIRRPYRIITSKKFILLVIVTVLLACLNRTEARPNKSVSLNAISSDGVEDAGVAAPVVVASGKEGAEGLSVIPAAKLNVPPLSDAPVVKPPSDATALPTKPNEVHTDNKLFHDAPHAANLKEPRDDGEDGESGGHGEDHAHERYPVSQVDFARVKTPFIIAVWILSASIAKIGFHMTPKLHLIFPESCLLIVVGVVIGVVLFFCTDVAVSPLTPNTFFFYMLPPIILDAGYFMPNRLFFDNLGTILLMAVVGTIFNIATIGGSLYACGLSGIFGLELKFLDAFLFSSLISAVDPVAVLAVFEEIHVNEILYIVVFGESLLNDAVTVVFYHMMEVYNEIGISNIIAQDVVSGVGSFFVVALGGTIIGIIWGFLTGLVTRFTDHVRVIEPIFIFVMAYLAYLNAEIFHMSGILAITFCGITMKNYVESNISQKSHTTVKYALKMLASSSETIIFVFLGVATVNDNHVWNTWFVVLTIVFCSVFRVAGVIILTAMANRFRLHKLSAVDQFVMSYGGLRGAVAFALVLLIDEKVVAQKNMFVTTTIAVVYFTVFLQGITIGPLVKILNVKRANKTKPTMNERIHGRFMDHLMAGIEDIVGKTGNYNVRDKFKRFDNRFIRPLLLRDSKGAEPKIIETYSKLTMRDAIEVMRRNPSTIGQMTGTESMSALFRTYTNTCIGGSPSLTNLDNTCSRNLDMHELDYNPSKKDLTDAKIHHLLAEELKPYRRHRRLSYSRHAVDDRDLSTQVNYKMQMNFRRMFNDRKHQKRSKRGGNKQEGVKTNHVSFPDFQQNGTTKQFTHEENIPKARNDAPTGNDDWDDGLTFTAKSTLAENPIPEEDRNLSRDSDGERRVATPTATESQLPWKRNGTEEQDAVQQNEFPAWASNKEYLAYNSPSATFLGGINKPKQPKSVIGLFRRESSGSRGGSGISDDGSSARGSDPALAAALSQMVPHHPNARLDKRSQSISGSSGAPSINVSDGHAGPFPVTASHRRNVRRGSMLELSGDTIPEETYYHGHSKSLCEPTGDEWETTPLAAAGSDHNTDSANSDKLLRSSGREPLLQKLTPRAQIRRGMGAGKSGSSGSGNLNRNLAATALLSTNYSDYDDDDEDEDFDLYDDENIVVTTTTNDAVGASGGNRSRNGDASNNTTTTIRLSHKNDESII